MILSIIIPVYNEQATLLESLRQVFETPVGKEIIIINDGSTDGSENILRDIERDFANKKLPDSVKSLRVFNQIKNQGKGSAVRAGVVLATGDITIIQDADLELDPREYTKLLEPFEKQGASVVFGSRFLLPSGRKNVPIFRYLGNKCMTWFSNVISGVHLTDEATCYKLFKREIIQSFTLTSNRFGIDPELIAQTAKQGHKVYEVPISYNPRTHQNGKKIGFFTDGTKAVFEIIKFNLF